ncbi:MAG: hypothetical protein OXB93_04365 [Cytophagales bacterium]|nr:hypothetical protein [Cytophagales bacterium]
MAHNCEAHISLSDFDKYLERQSANLRLNSPYNKLISSLRGYLGGIREHYGSDYTKDLQRGILRSLTTLSENEATIGMTRNIVYRQIIEVFDKYTINNTDLDRVIVKNVRASYQRLLDKKDVGGIYTKLLPDPTFDLVDQRAVDALSRIDKGSFSTYLKDKGSQDRIKRVIGREYLAQGLSPTRLGVPNITKASREILRGVKLEDWKLTRIISTSMNRARAMGAVTYFQKIGVKKFIIRGITDNRQCPYYRALQGKILRVEPEISKMENLQEGVFPPFVQMLIERHQRNYGAIRGRTYKPEE